MAIFPGGLGLAGTRTPFPFWIVLERRMMEWWWQMELYKTCKAPGTSLPTTNKTSSCFTGQIPFLLPHQQCQNIKGKSITLHGVDHPRSSGVFQ